MHFILNKWLLAFVFFTVNVSCLSQPLAIKYDSIYNIAPYLEVFNDTHKNLTIEDVLHHQPAFVKNGLKVPVFSSGNANNWCRFRINDLIQKPLYLIVHAAAIDTVILYTVRNNVVVNVQHSGNLFSFNERPVKAAFPVFDLPYSVTDSTVFYMRLHITNSRQFPITIGTAQKVAEAGLSNYFFTGMFYGLMVIMVFYNLFIWFRMQENAFLHYIFYLLFISLTIAQNDGFMFQFLWPNTPQLNNFLGFFASMSGIFGMMMIVAFLDLGKEKKAFYKIAIALVFVFSGAAVWSLIRGANVNMIYIRAIIFAGSLFYIYVGYVYNRRGFRPASFFMIAWMTVTVFVMINILREYGIVPYNFFTANALKIGAALQVLLLGLAMGDRTLYYKDRYTNTLEKYKKVQSQKDELAQSLEATVHEKVKAKTDEMMEKDVFKNKIITIISHDLKSPVNSLQMILNMLDTKSLSGAEAGMLMEKVKEQIKESSIMMDNILEWSRIQLQGFKLQKNLNSVPDLTEHVIKGMETQANAKNISIDYTSKIDKPVNIDADIFKLVLRNLLSNALKFSHINSVIEVSDNITANYLAVHVKDTGVGIPPDKFGLLFDMSKKYTTMGTSQESGSGLGLKMAFEFAQKHGGNIMAESKPGQGSTFTFTLKTN